MSVDVLKRSGVALLTTYRRDGRGVGTPVHVRIEDGRAYFMTRPGSAKVERLARNPEVTLAPCTPTGKPTGPPCVGGHGVSTAPGPGPGSGSSPG